MSSKETVLLELNLENAYKSCSPLPNVNPRWPQLFNVEPVVYLIQADEWAVIVVGSNLNNYWPQQLPVLKLDKTYAIGDGPELITIDLISLL